MAEGKPHPRFPFNCRCAPEWRIRWTRSTVFRQSRKQKRQMWLKGDKYRITVLTEGLLRLEYSEDGVFRGPGYADGSEPGFFPETDYEVKETEEELVLVTKRLRLTYNRKAL